MEDAATVIVIILCSMCTLAILPFVIFEFLDLYYSIKALIKEGPHEEEEDGDE